MLKIVFGVMEKEHYLQMKFAHAHVGLVIAGLVTNV